MRNIERGGRVEVGNKSPLVNPQQQEKQQSRKMYKLASERIMLMPPVVTQTAAFGA